MSGRNTRQGRLGFLKGGEVNLRSTLLYKQNIKGGRGGGGPGGGPTWPKRVRCRYFIRPVGLPICIFFYSVV